MKPFDPATDPADEADRAPDGAAVHPAGFCHGPGLIVVHGNPAFRRVFGDGSVGLPAREGMLGLSRTGFTLMDAVLRQGRPLARWVRLAGETWRMTASPRIDPGSGEIYGVAFHLRPRDPQPPEATG
ncbi:MAG: hypothetical protein ABSD62_09930 [Candidatus Limnocylindrales bacterium]